MNDFNPKATQPERPCPGWESCPQEEKERAPDRKPCPYREKEQTCPERLLYLPLVIIGGFGAFILVQQQAPATEHQVQDVAKESTAGCCGASTVEGETSPATPGGCCGTSAPETAQSGDAAQQTQPPVVPETRQTVPEAPQSDATDTGGCGCGSP